jgi:tape measure domain-containing protein
MNNINATMTVAAGSASAAGQQIAFIREESERLGLFFPSVAKQMAQFAAAARTSSITGEELEMIFTGISEASRAMGLTAPQAEGAMLALQQMMSKGKVSAEELRQQLGERMPGSIQIMASALDISTEKLFEMMENGQLLSDEVLPKFGAELQKVFGSEAARQADRIAASIQRLRTSFFDLMAQGNLSGAAAAIDELAITISSPEFQNSFDSLVQSMSELAGLAAENIDFLKDLVKALVAVGAGIGAMRLTAAVSGFFNMSTAAATATGSLKTMAVASTTLSTSLRTLAGPVGLITSVAGLALLFKNNAEQAGRSTKDWAMEVERLRGNFAALEAQQIEKDLLEAELQVQKAQDLRREVERLQSLLESDVRFSDLRKQSILGQIEALEEQIAKTGDARVAAMLLRMRLEQLNRSGNETSEVMSDIADEVDRASDGIKRFAPLIENLDFLPIDQRVRAEQTQRLLDIIQNTSVSQEELLSIVKKTGEEGDRIYSDMEQALRDVGSVIKDDVSNGLTDIIMQAESAKDVFQSLLDTIARTLIQQQVVDPFVSSIGASLPSFFGGGEGSTSLGGGAPPNVRGIGPARANGGNVYGNTAHLVGERGPEMFVPRQDGSIVPNHKMGGSPNVNVNIINKGGEALSVQSQSVRKSPNGETNIDLMVKSSIDRLDSQGQLDGMFRRHGGTRQGRF